MTALRWIRRRAATHLAARIGLMVFAMPAAATGQSEAARAQRVVSVVTTVKDLTDALPFYRDMLGFVVASDTEFVDARYDRLTGIFATRVRIVTLTLGPDTVELVDFVTPEGRDLPGPVRSNDQWFQHLALVVSDIEAATDRLRENGVRLISPEPQRFPDGRAFLYFQDPDGNPLELAEFPDEEPVRPGSLFQRIDHTALVVAELEPSIRFYRSLGFEVENRFTSRSPTQQRLNSVFGAHLEIASLKLPGDDFGVELLQYLTPPGGRPFPPDARPNDLVHRRTVVAAPDARRLYDVLRAAGAEMRSAEVVDFGGDGALRGQAFFVADPSGHVLEVRSRR